MEHTDDKENIGECCSFRGHRGAQQNQNTTTTTTVDTHALPAFALSSCQCNARPARLPAAVWLHCSNDSSCDLETWISAVLRFLHVKNFQRNVVFDRSKCAQPPHDSSTLVRCDRLRSQRYYGASHFRRFNSVHRICICTHTMRTFTVQCLRWPSQPVRQPSSLACASQLLSIASHNVHTIRSFYEVDDSCQL